MYIIINLVIICLLLYILYLYLLYLLFIDKKYPLQYKNESKINEHYYEHYEDCEGNPIDRSCRCHWRRRKEAGEI